VGALDAVEWEACLLDPVHDPEAEQALRRASGMVPRGAYYFLDSAWVTDAFMQLRIDQVPLRHLSAELAGLIALAVSQDNSCRYCYAGTRSMMRILGYPEERIRLLEEDALELSPANSAVLTFARRVSRAAPITCAGDGRALLEVGWSAEAVKEIAFSAISNVFFNRLTTMPALPLPETDIARRWYIRLLRPLIALRLKPRRAVAPDVLTAAQRSGPFAEIVNALDGLPGAARLRGIIDAAWLSPVLSRRTKALVFAVVARGVGCTSCEPEAVRLLAGEGLAAPQIEHALAHLGGPELSQIDSAAAALARESIWYRPAHIQRHLRSIRSLFTREQLIELIGITALANAVCRLGVAVDIERQQH
jgi:alkylhydroperoxidase family enzyme